MCAQCANENQCPEDSQFQKLDRNRLIEVAKIMDAQNAIASLEAEINRSIIAPRNSKRQQDMRAWKAWLENAEKEGMEQ